MMIRDQSSKRKAKSAGTQGFCKVTFSPGAITFWVTLGVWLSRSDHLARLLGARLLGTRLFGGEEDGALCRLRASRKLTAEAVLGARASGPHVFSFKRLSLLASKENGGSCISKGHDAGDHAGRRPAHPGHAPRPRTRATARNSLTAAQCRTLIAFHHCQGDAIELDLGNGFGLDYALSGHQTDNKLVGRLCAAS